MAGRWLSTVAANSAAHIKDWRAYEQGAAYRLGGTALEVPATNNPFPSGTPENVLWATGWTASDGGEIDPMSSYTGQTAPA